MCTSIGADSLGYISQEGMVEATRQPLDRLCTACFTGAYPIPLPESQHLGKGVLELQLAFDGERPVPSRPPTVGHRAVQSAP